MSSKDNHSPVQQGDIDLYNIKMSDAVNRSELDQLIS